MRSVGDRGVCSGGGGGGVPGLAAPYVGVRVRENGQVCLCARVLGYPGVCGSSGVGGWVGGWVGTCRCPVRGVVPIRPATQRSGTSAAPTFLEAEQYAECQ